MQVNKQQPAFQIVTDKVLQTDHSLSADLAMGWRPKLKVIGPIPLNFDNPFIDKSIKQILKSQASIYSIIYLGPRPLNTFKMHEVLKKKYKYKYQHLFSVQYGQLKAFFHKFYSQFEPKMKMPFLGMNPQFKSHKFTFDSCFQSGNLDCVIKVGECQYDLILRIDSNTAGHIMWYYFKVKNNEDKNNRVKFNIVNLRRNKSCYQRGMKPFIRRKKKVDTANQTKQQWTDWQQGGISVEVTQDKLRFAKQTIVFEHGMVGIEEPPVIFRKLSFEVDFQPQQEIEFAYCIPYTYSDMMTDIKEWKQSIIDRDLKNIHFGVDMSNQSLSGLEIPLIKITEKQGEKYQEENQKNKQSIFIIGRQHPGESNGSIVMKGLVSQLIDDSQESRFLRKHIVFTIIPMLNVDGVVMGNFRTSLYGKDLNRLFRKQQLFLIPEVQMCKQEFDQLIKIYKTKIMLFLDVHGHSARRNAFCYGPGILDSNSFNDVRELAKIIATKTEIFRYPSCSFRIQHDKKTTARACFSKSVKLAYTIESSNWSFYSRSLARMIDFTSQYWESIGIDIIYSLAEYAQDKIIKIKGKNKKAKNKNNYKNTVNKINEKRNLINGQGNLTSLKSQTSIRESPKKTKIKRAQTTKQIQIPSENEQNNSSKILHNKTYGDKMISNKNLSQEQQSGRQTISKSSKYLKMQQIEEQQNESDKMSDNQMDSDSQGEDMQTSKFQRYMNGAKRMMIEFQKVYLGNQYEKKGSTAAKVRQEKARLANKDSRNFKKNSQVLACMRKKEPTPQQFQQLQVVVNNKSPEVIKSKPLSQPHRKQLPASLPLNTKQIQFQYEPFPQQPPIARQIMLVNHKVQFQKILLPRIEQSYQVKRKRQYLEQMNLHEHRENNDSKLQEWTHGQKSPQLLMNEDSQQEQAYYNSFKNRNINRQKSISNYERGTRNNRVDFYKNQDEYNELKEQKNQERVNYEQEKNYQETQRKNETQNHERINDNMTQSLNEKQNNWLQNVQVLRYSMKVSANNQSKESILTKTKRELQQIKKNQLIEKLTDPISKAYQQSSIYLQQAKGIKQKIPIGLVQIQGISVAKKEQQKSQRISSNSSKIKQIIHNNLEENKFNRKSYVRTKKQKPKIINQKLKISNQSPMIIKSQDFRDPLIDSLGDPKNFILFSGNNNNKNISPQKNSNLLNTDKGQSLISASVILPRGNLKQASQKIRTLESQNILKTSQQSTNTLKYMKNVLSASRNFSERQKDIQLDILKQQERLNTKALKFGDFLPKLKQNSKTSPQKQFSKTKISLHKPMDYRQKQPTLKSQKLVKIKSNLGVDNSIQKERDLNEIKLVVNGNIDKSQRQSPELQRQSQNSKKRDSPLTQKQPSNRQILMNRLKQLQYEDLQQFGEGNLLVNQKQQSSREYHSNIHGEERKQFQKNQKLKTNVSEQFHNLQKQENHESPTKKQIKIFALPSNRYSVSMNANKQLTINK